MSPEKGQIFSEVDGHRMPPSWSKVSSEFKIPTHHSLAEQRVLISYVNAHRKIAQGQEKRGRAKMNSLVKHPVFKNLEEKDSDFLDQIARFVRKG